MSSTTKLLPCPFCSNADISIKNENPKDNSGGYFIECPGCGASTALRFACGDDPTHLLAEQWNRRTASNRLHQIQEPEADIWPCVNIDVDASGKITNAKLYSPGLPAGNHDVYPVRVPYMDEHTEAWLACAAELRKHLPEFMHLRDMNGIECAVAAIRELAERSAPEQAAPAAVAVPDSSNLGFAVEQRGDVWVVVDDAGGVCPASPHECALWNALIEARAALAATPAASEPAQTIERQRMTAGRASFFMERFLKEEKLLGPNEQAALHFVIDMLEKAAAPVVLPEPDAAITEVMGLMRDWGRKEHLSGEAQLDAACSEATPVDEDRAKRCWAEEREARQAIETKLRALLARVSAPVPQAVEQAPVLYVSQGQLANHRDPDGPDSTAHGRYLPARVTPAGKFTTPLFAAPHALTPAARDVLAERQRQITQEGYDPQHDDDQVNDEIAAMAALFIMPEGARDWDATSTSYGDTLAEALLPSDWEMPNFGDDRRLQLVKGTAMGLAEIERIDRADIAAAKEK